MVVKSKNIFSILAFILSIVALLLVLYFIFSPHFGPSSRHHDISHLLQNPNDHVVLSREHTTGGCGSIASEFFRLFPDGSKGDDPFRVPVDKLLVVTDVDWWLADFREPSAAGFAKYFDLALEHQRDNVITTYRVFRDTKLTDPQDRLGRSVPMTAGFVVAPDTRICPFAQVAPSTDPEVLRMTVILRGYLIDDAVETRREGQNRAQP